MNDIYKENYFPQNCAMKIDSRDVKILCEEIVLLPLVGISVKKDRIWKLTCQCEKSLIKGQV